MQVKHSQAMNAASLKVWVLAKDDGQIVTAHCNCMAGQGESCSHIGALIFAIITKIELELQKSATDKENKWLQPNLKKSTFRRISDIDFRSAAMKKRKIFESNIDKEIEREKKISPPKENELKEFFNSVAESGYKSAILSIIPEHQHLFARDKINLKNIFDLKYRNKPLSEIVSLAKDIFYNKMKYTTEELDNIAKNNNKAK